MMDPPVGDTVVKTRDQNARKIERLEHWLINIRGGMQ
jgi:hypothetical protein